VSYLQNVYVVDFEYQKEENCIILTISLLSRFCVSEMISFQQCASHRNIVAK